MHAVIQYATWRKLAQEELDLESLPEVASNLEAHLDPARDRSETTRAAFGARLGLLDWVDPQWLADRLPLLFPADCQPLRLATWETFLGWVRPSERLLELLSSEYQRAVDEPPTLDQRRSRAGKDPGLALAEHLATYACWGTLDLEPDALLHRFATKSSADEFTRFVDFIGWSLDNNEVTPEVRDRLVAVLEHVGAWTQERPEASGYRFSRRLAGGTAPVALDRLGRRAVASTSCKAECRLIPISESVSDLLSVRPRTYPPLSRSSEPT